MTSSPRKKDVDRSFFEKHFATLVMVGITAMGLVANFTLMGSKVDELRRRTEILEKDLVPRSEHLMRDEQLNKRLDLMQDQIKNVQETANQINMGLMAQKLSTLEHK